MKPIICPKLTLVSFRRSFDKMDFMLLAKSDVRLCYVMRANMQVERVPVSPYFPCGATILEWISKLIGLNRSAKL